MKILILISENPDPPYSGPKVRNYYLWEEMERRGHEVKVLSLGVPPESSPKRDFLKGIEYIPYTKYSKIIKAFRYLLYSHHQYRFSHKMINEISRLILDWGPDIIHAEELKMGSYLPTSKLYKGITSCTAHNVESLLIKQNGSLPLPFGRPIINWIHRINLKRYEIEVSRRTSVFFTYSKEDLFNYQKILPIKNITSSSNGAAVLEIEHSQIKDLKSLLITGSLDYLPNTEGVRFFLERIYPRIRGKYNVVIAGSKASDEMKKLIMSLDVEFHDSPESLRPFYQECFASIVPLYKGSGTRTKIVESMAYGRPVLSTMLGAEGLYETFRDGIFIFSDENDFMSRLDEIEGGGVVKQNQIGEKMRNTALSVFDWSVVAENLEKSWMKNRN